MRLIDADELEETFLKQRDTGLDHISMDFVIHKINVQPTAYDADKVVGQLIEEANNTIVDFKKDKYIYTSKAIEIVRAGGID